MMPYLADLQIVHHTCQLDPVGVRLICEEGPSVLAGCLECDSEVGQLATVMGRYQLSDSSTSTCTKLPVELLCLLGYKPTCIPPGRTFVGDAISAGDLCEFCRKRW